MAYETVLFEIASGVARLTLNRPERLNAFTVQMHEEIADALTKVETDDAIRVLLITGAGRAFCAGQDLADRTVAPGGAGVDLGHSLGTYYNPLIRRLVNLRKPVVCGVNGVAAGAGANMAFAADIVVAAKSATFIQSFANIGLIPDSGGTWILPRLVGQARAMGLAMTGQPIGAEQAEQWGLIWRAVDDEGFGAEIGNLAQRLAMGPTKGLAAVKRAIRRSWSSGLDAHLNHERDTQSELGRSADYKEGVAAFAEKRKPDFTGH